MKTFGLYLTGHKGLLVLEKLEATPSFVVTYSDPKANQSEDDAIQNLCERRGIALYCRQDVVPEVDICFYIGWQYIIKKNLDKSVVLHDSYLPKMKGFSPTPTALILGQPLGVTAFQPTDGEIDDGPIYMRKFIKTPMRLAEANNEIAYNYVTMIQTILFEDVDLTVIDESETFCIWRDEEDMIIDWSQPAERIQRMVYALGFPLSGAKSKYRGKNIVVKEVELNDEMEFIERHPGKIWSIKDNCPKIICGIGMLTITEAIFDDGSGVKFNRLRVRVGK